MRRVARSLFGIALQYVVQKGSAPGSLLRSAGKVEGLSAQALSKRPV
jgi:hypothetical protein